jgi:hypothetical protein
LVYNNLHTSYLPFLGCKLMYPNTFGVHVHAHPIIGVCCDLTPKFLVYTLVHTKILVYMK